MKIGKRSIEMEPSEQMNNLNSIVKADKVQKSFLITILPILSMIVAIFPGMLYKASGIAIAKIGILTLILTSAITIYIHMNETGILSKKLAKTIITLGYLGSICLLFFIPKANIFSFWMLGGLLIAILFDSKLGILMHFNLSFILGISLALPLETVIQMLIIGVMMCMLSGAIKDKSTVIYAIVIVLSTNITLSFVINNFIFEANVNFNYLNSLFSILAVLVAAFLLCSFYQRIGNDNAVDITVEQLPENTVSENIFQEGSSTLTDSLQNDKEIPTQEIKAETTDASETILKLPEARTSYEILCDEENELLLKLKQFSQTLYNHSVFIADLSYRAAKEIKANEMLAKAGGLYHEVGKINGKNYIEEGLLIAEDYAFPKELRAILKEHNIKYEKPSSIEAAIVMLSDNVISTIEYIEKTGDQKFTATKIIDNIFQMRMEKGTFDVIDLSLMDFKILKEFYQKEFKQS